MIEIGGHHINPAHVSAIHVVKGTRLNERYKIEIILMSGYAFTIDSASNDLATIEQQARLNAKFIQEKVLEETAAVTIAAMGLAKKALD